MSNPNVASEAIVAGGRRGAGLVSVTRTRTSPLPRALAKDRMAHAPEGACVGRGHRQAAQADGRTRGVGNILGRWCSMSACGNRAKVSAHRSRKKEAAL